MTDLEKWASERDTDEVVAAAIIAVAGQGRSANDVWENPSPSEERRVMEMIERLILAGFFKECDDATYYWGDRSMRIYIDHGFDGEDHPEFEHDE